MLKLSIITVTYNAAFCFQRTIDSIKSQVFKNFEWIVVDGLSGDNTLKMIKENTDVISHWISEKDEGIYDAMNKGLQMARGEYVLFLNAGDVLHTPSTLQQIFSVGLEVDIFYSDTLIQDAESGKIIGKRSQYLPHRLPGNLSWKDMQKGMVVSHQSFIVKKDIAPYYDIQYRYSSDIDWVINCLKKTSNTLLVEPEISLFLTGGFSQKHRISSWKDRFFILKKHFGYFKTLKNHVLIIFRYIAHQFKKH